MRTHRVGSLAVAVLFGATANADPAFDAQVEATLDFAADQASATVADLGGPPTFPRSVAPGTSTWKTVTASDWTSGFFPGLLWMLHARSGDAGLLAAAEAWTAEVAGQATRTDTHDLGFMVGIPTALALEATGDPAHEATLLTAAESLATRFDPDVGAIRSWDFGSWQFPVIIDNMMNLELLVRAAALAPDPGDAAAWLAIVSDHAATSRAEHVRGDGSTYHVVDFDPTTGAVVGKETFQGLSDDSTWSRGQAWAIHGFATRHRLGGDLDDLDTAVAVADYFIDNLPGDFVPYWDFDVTPGPTEPRDSSAAAIAADGLLLLSTLVSDPADADRFRDAAVSILTSLMSPAYLSDGSSPALLLHGTVAKPFDKEVDHGLIWGDYYLVSALLRYQEITALPVPALGTGWAFGLAVSFLGVGAFALGRSRRR